MSIYVLLSIHNTPYQHVGIGTGGEMRRDTGSY